MAFNMPPPKIDKGTPEEFARLNSWLSELHKFLNGGISITKNASQMTIEVTFRGAGVETPVEHGLNRVPEGFQIVGNKTAGAVITETATERTKNRIYLQSDTSGAKVKVLVF